MIYHISITVCHEINDWMFCSSTSAITHDCAPICFPFVFYGTDVLVNICHFLIQIFTSNLFYCWPINSRSNTSNCVNHRLIIRTTINRMKWYDIKMKKFCNCLTNFFDIFFGKIFFYSFLEGNMDGSTPFDSKPLALSLKLCEKALLLPEDNRLGILELLLPAM